MLIKFWEQGGLGNNFSTSTFRILTPVGVPFTPLLLNGRVQNRISKTVSLHFLLFAAGPWISEAIFPPNVRNLNGQYNLNSIFNKVITNFTVRQRKGI